MRSGHADRFEAALSAGHLMGKSYGLGNDGRKNEWRAAKSLRNRVRPNVKVGTSPFLHYGFVVFSMAEQLEGLPSLQRVAIPDLWQQQAVSALREGSDVVVQAPTGAGKTLIFELWSNQGRNRGQAIYTVPTRALANDKLAEWRARGWDVGIATGDLSENLSAPVLVATLETQKHRLIQGEGPALLVVDEYQMLGDLDRGLNYELALALAPAKTQLLLLSGSVANPQSVVQWLQRLGRKAVLIRHDLRPVPLEEVHINNLNFHVPSEIRGYWPRLAAKALAILEERKITSLIVVDAEQKVEGVVHLHDLWGLELI